MFTLSFNTLALPRTMTREQWREADRWRRTTARKICKALGAQLRVEAEQMLRVHLASQDSSVEKVP